MEKEQAMNVIKWLKRIAAVSTIGVWMYVMLIFLRDPAPFSELVPYCMGSTMLIFGILSGIYKGLEYWEAHYDEKGKDEEKIR